MLKYTCKQFNAINTNKKQRKWGWRRWKGKTTHNQQSGVLLNVIWSNKIKATKEWMNGNLNWIFF